MMAVAPPALGFWVVAWGGGGGFFAAGGFSAPAALGDVTAPGIGLAHGGPGGRRTGDRPFRGPAGSGGGPRSLPGVGGGFFFAPYPGRAVPGFAPGPSLTA